MDTYHIRLRKSIDAFLADRKISPRQFGVRVVGDASFVHRLRQGRSPSLRTVDRILVSIGQEPLAPKFLRQVETFIAVTGIKPYYLGQETTGNNSFIYRLRAGLSPTLRTVDHICNWMRNQATEDEWKEVQAALNADMSEPEGTRNGPAL